MTTSSDRQADALIGMKTPRFHSWRGLYPLRFADTILKKSNRDGTAAIEYAIVLPVLMLLILGIIDTGRVLWTYATLARAADAAARCGAVNVSACGTTAKIQQDAVTEAWGLTLTAAVFTVTTPSCGVQVTANYTFQFFTPGFTTLTLNPRACYPQ